jgi:hypothetical protein
VRVDEVEAHSVRVGVAQYGDDEVRPSLQLLCDVLLDVAHLIS